MLKKKGGGGLKMYTLNEITGKHSSMTPLLGFSESTSVLKSCEIDVMDFIRLGQFKDR